jgi:hypothetical protein
MPRFVETHLPLCIELWAWVSLSHLLGLLRLQNLNECPMIAPEFIVPKPTGQTGVSTQDEKPLTKRHFLTSKPGFSTKLSNKYTIARTENC